MSMELHVRVFQEPDGNWVAATEHSDVAVHAFGFTAHEALEALATELFEHSRWLESEPKLSGRLIQELEMLRQWTTRTSGSQQP